MEDDFQCGQCQICYFTHPNDWVPNHCGVVWGVQNPEVLACAESRQSNCCLALPHTTTGDLFQLAHLG